MNKLSQIFKGFIFSIFSKNQKLSENRMRFCKVCPKKGKYLGVIDKCNECGCLLNLKTRVSESSCPINKWSENKIDLYKEALIKNGTFYTDNIDDLIKQDRFLKFKENYDEKYYE